MKKQYGLLIFICFLLSCSIAEDDKRMEKAKIIFNANCSMCHGINGHGDGQVGKAFNPPPRNFLLPTDKWKNGKTKEGIIKTLTYGIEPNMWKYGGPEEDIPLLADYILLLGK